MSVNCGNAVVRIVLLLPAHARSRPRAPAAGRCLVHVECTARLRCTVSLGTGLSCFAHYAVAGQSTSRVVREYPPMTTFVSSIAHATGARQVGCDVSPAL